MNPIRHEDLIQVGNPFLEAINGAKLLLEEVNKLQANKKIKIRAEIETIRNASPNTKAGQVQIATSSNEIIKQANDAKVLYDQYGRVVKQIDNMAEAAKVYGDEMAKANKKSQEQTATKKQTFDTGNERYIKSLSSVQRQHTNETIRQLKEVEREQKRSIQAQIREEKSKQSSMDALQRQRSQALIKAWRDELREQKRVTDQKIAEARREAKEIASAQQSLNTQRIRAYQSTTQYTNNLKLQKLRDAENAATPGTYAKLSASLSRATFEMKNFHKVGSEGYKRLERDAASYNAQLKKLDASHGVFGRNVGNYISAIRNAWMGITVALAGTYYAFRKVVMWNAELSDSMAAVRRTTGMTQGEVSQLNETLRQLDTRTAQTSLLDLAHVAGKLGIAKEEVAGFVKSADMIGVALGKDIGNNEEAINQLGRIVQIFKEDFNGQKMEESLIRIGSSIKDLGNASVAEETNILDFTKRLGGIAPVAGLSVDKVMALAATMDILGQTMEVSSTAISQIFIAMASKTEKFANIAGMSLGKFTRLMRTNFNEAFIAVAKGFQKNNGAIEEVAEYFKDLGLDGRRLIGVMTVLSDKTDVYREQMKIAKRSLDEGTTAAKQFAIQNETLAANLDKAGKAFKNFLANSGTLSFLNSIVRGISGALEEISDRLSSDPIVKLTQELKVARRSLQLEVEQNETTSILPKFIEKFREEQYIKTIKHLEDQIKAIETQRIEQKKLNDEIRTRVELERQALALLGGRFGETPQAESWFPKQYKPKTPIMQDPSLVPTDIEYLALQGNIDAQRELTKKQLEEEKRRREAYYQFLLKLGMLTAEKIVEHERQLLKESGAWAKASAKERIAWEEKAFIDAFDEVNKRKIELMDLFYEEQVQGAKRNGIDTYAIEREYLNRKMLLYAYDETKYRELKQKLLNLDDEYADKAMKRWDEYYKELRQLRQENELQAIENEVISIDTKINTIEEKRVSGGNGAVGQTLSQADITELEGLYKQRNALIDKYTDVEVAIIQSKIYDIEALKRKMLDMGVLSSEDIAKYDEQIKSLKLQIENKQLNAVSEKKSPSLKLEQGTRPFDKFFEPEQWQSDMQKILGIIQSFTSAADSLLSSLSESYRINMENEISVAENRYQREYDAIDRMLANGSISEQQAANKRLSLEKRQKLEQERIQKKYAEKQRDIAYAQAGVNLALSVTNAIATVPFPASLLVAALYLAAGAIQLGNISSAKFEKGGYGEVGKEGVTLKGKRHSQGGIKIKGVGEAEEGEYFAIINRDATKKYKKQLPTIFKAINEHRLSVNDNNGVVSNHNQSNDYRKYLETATNNYPSYSNISNDNRTTQLFDRRGIQPQVVVNMKDQYGKDMLREMRRPQTRVYDEGVYTVYETGNYRLKTSKQ